MKCAPASVVRSSRARVTASPRQRLFRRRRWSPPVTYEPVREELRVRVVGMRRSEAPRLDAGSASRVRGSRPPVAGVPLRPAEAPAPAAATRSACTRESAWNRSTITSLQRALVMDSEDHALVMGHERPDNHPIGGDGVGGFTRLVRLARRVVDGFVEPELALRTRLRQAQQILHRRLRPDRQRQRGGVRRDHQIVGEAPLQSEARHAEGLVLIVVRSIDDVVGGLGDPPGHAALVAVLNLPATTRRYVVSSSVPGNERISSTA